MATETDISNLALSHFGQDASIDSIDPPDGSVEAEHAQRFLPIARDEILEAFPWSFAKRRATLAELVFVAADCCAFHQAATVRRADGVDVGLHRSADGLTFSASLYGPRGR